MLAHNHPAFSTICKMCQGETENHGQQQSGGSPVTISIWFSTESFKLPSLVPEFSKVITRSVPINGQVDNIVNAKKLSSNPIESSRMKGGVMSVRLLVMMPHLMVMKQWKGQDISVKHGVSTVLLRSSWPKLVKPGMAPQERELGASMHDDVRATLASKRIRLWEKMLLDARYPDMGVVQEFVQGTSLIGEVEQRGLWPSKFSPSLSLITEAELFEISERDKTAVLHRVACADNPTTNKAVWDKTIAEDG